jgi:hypothetical protein
MAFVHKVPGRYLTLVEELLNSTCTGMGKESVDLDMGMEVDLGVLDPALDDRLVKSGDGGRLSAAHQLALEVFAHWLVLVLLLDDVWWIGGIGAWELGRVVALRRDGRWPLRTCTAGEDGDWWPGSMLEVSRLRERYK